MNSEYIVLRVKENMFGEFTEPTQLKTSLAKYSIEFNDLAVQMRPHHRIAYLRLLGRPYTLLYVRRSVGRYLSTIMDITVWQKVKNTEKNPPPLSMLIYNI